MLTNQPLFYIAVDYAGATWLGCAVGMATGCLLGLTPLLFFPQEQHHHAGGGHPTAATAAAAASATPG